MDEKKQSFWTTIPGILTGVAAVISAVAALYVALHQNKQPPPSVQEPPRATSQAPHAPQRPQVTPQQLPVTPPQARVTPLSTPDSLSRTEYSLPGDAILHFRVAEIRGRDMTIEVDYRFNAQHGEKVMVGARLKGVASGYKPTFVPSRLEGTARLQMIASGAGTSKDIQIFLYEWGRPAEPFAERTFPYQMRFE
jgi:hypothetical protein